MSLRRVQRFIDIEPIPLEDYYENIPIEPTPTLGTTNIICAM